MQTLEAIRDKVRQRRYEFSKHAVDQNVVCSVGVAEVEEAILGSSEVVEDYPDNRYGPSCLILGFTESGRPLHIQCSYPSRPFGKIITLYERDPDRWINLRTRRDSERGNSDMKETMIEKEVTYTIEHGGKLHVVQHVPARVCEATGEQFFAPETVEHIQRIINGEGEPVPVVEPPVYEYV